MDDDDQARRLHGMLQELESLLAEMLRLRGEIADELERTRRADASAETQSYPGPPPDDEPEKP